MDNSKELQESCKSVFREETGITKEKFTKVWIELINRLEKNKYSKFTK